MITDGQNHLAVTSIRRRAAITGGLVGAGAVCGAAAGGVALTVALMISPPLSFDLDVITMGFLFGGFYGAPLGAIAAPVLGWTLLRRVPLGRMFAFCAAGTIVGGLIGWFGSVAGGDVAVNGLAGAAIGCVVAAINLWYRARPRTLEA